MPLTGAPLFQCDSLLGVGKCRRNRTSPFWRQLTKASSCPGTPAECRLPKAGTPDRDRDREADRGRTRTRLTSGGGEPVDPRPGARRQHRQAAGAAKAVLTQLTRARPGADVNAGERCPRHRQGPRANSRLLSFVVACSTSREAARQSCVKSGLRGEPPRERRPGPVQCRTGVRFSSSMTIPSCATR